MKKLYKDTCNKKISGVCSGLSIYFNSDVTIFRLLFVLLAFITGFLPITIFYVICAIVMPDDDGIIDAD